MLTRARFHEVCETHTPPPLAKGMCILIQGKIYYIMAKLATDAENPITYNICDENLLNPQFGVRLENAETIPAEVLSESIQRRARNFV